MPMALALLNAAFPPQRRGWAIGIYGSVTGLAAVLGPVIGGAVTQGLSWQWIFWLNVPIALAAIPFVLTRVAESFGDPAPARPARPGCSARPPRWPGVGADPGQRRPAGPARGRSARWPAVRAAVVAFVAWQRRAAAPMLPMRLFGSRAFSAGNVVDLPAQRDADRRDLLHRPVPAGQPGARAAAAPGCGCCRGASPPVLIAPRAGALADRFGERPLVVAGTGRCSPSGMAWLALVASPGQSDVPADGRRR